MKNSDFQQVYSDTPERTLDVVSKIALTLGIIASLLIFVLREDDDDPILPYILLSFGCIISTLATYGLLRAIANILRCLKCQTGLYVDERTEENEEIENDSDPTGTHRPSIEENEEIKETKNGDYFNS